MFSSSRLRDGFDISQHISDSQHRSFKRLQTVASTGKTSDPEPKDSLLSRFGIPIFSKPVPAKPIDDHSLQTIHNSFGINHSMGGFTPTATDPNQIPNSPVASRPMNMHRKPHENRSSLSIPSKSASIQIQPNSYYGKTKDHDIGSTSLGNTAVVLSTSWESESAHSPPNSMKRPSTSDFNCPPSDVSVTTPQSKARADYASPTSPILTPDSQLAKAPQQVQVAFRDMAMLLWHKTPDVQAAAANLLADCALNSVESRCMVRECGALATLIALLRSPNEKVRKSAVLAISACSEGSETNRRLISASALPHLAFLLSSKDLDTKQAALRAIGNVCDASSFAALHSCRALELIMDLIRDGVEKEVIQCALDTLVILSSEVDCQHALGTMGAVQRFVHMIEESDYRLLHPHLSRAIGALCRDCRANQEDLRVMGGLQIVLDLLRRSKDLDVFTILESIIHMVGNNEYNQHCLQNGPNLVLLFKYFHAQDSKIQRVATQLFSRCLDISEVSKSQAFNAKKAFTLLESHLECSDQSCNDALSIIVGCISSNAVHQEVLLQTNVLSKAEALLASNDLNTIHMCCSLLEIMCKNNSSVQSRLKDKIAMNHLLQKFDTVDLCYETHLQILLAFIELSRNEPSTAHEFCRSGALHFCIKGLQTTNEEIKLASALLSKLCINNNEFAADHIRRTKIVSVLASLLSGHNNVLRKEVTDTLIAVVNSEPMEMSATLRDASGIKHLVDYLETCVELSTINPDQAAPKVSSEHENLSDIDIDLNILAQSLQLLDACLMEDGQSREVINKSSGMRVLHALLIRSLKESWPEAVSLYASRAIGSACIQHELNRAAVHEGKVLISILQLHTKANKNLVAAMAYTLGRVLEDSVQNKHDFGEASGVSILFKLIAKFKRENGVLEWIVSALHHAVTDHENNTTSIRLIGGFPILLELLSSTEQEVLWRTARLLGYLARCSDLNRMCLLTDGATTNLSRLLDHPNSYVRHFADAALQAFEPPEAET